jgi:hypothetical protein
MKPILAPILSGQLARAGRPIGSLPLHFAMLSLMLAFASGARADDKPKLTFKQDGSDLVVSTTVTVNGGPHVLWTSSNNLEKQVALNYYVIQCADRLYRHQKQVDVVWRIVKHKQGDETYHVENRFMPSTAQLKELLPQLEALSSHAR